MNLLSKFSCQQTGNKRRLQVFRMSKCWSR